MISGPLKDRLREFRHRSGWITLLTGAGISAESGIPTFRGSEGYWTVGSREYHPQEMATRRTFQKNPLAVWTWYLYRMGVCARAEPNPGHLALTELEKLFPEHFTLITQNVDNLHLRAGNSPGNTYQIHGNIFYCRCLDECEGRIYSLPDGLLPKKKGEELSEGEQELLVCSNCGSWLRPHVLWFDETYNEAYYRFNSSLAAASRTELLIIIGTSGSTNLPQQVAWQVYQNGGTIVDINITPDSFSDLAQKSPGGAFLQGSSSAVLPELLEIIS